jgi:hypothetical protein
MRQQSLVPITRALALVLAAGAGACSGGLSDQFFIVQNQVPQTSDNACMIPADKGATYRGSGVMDVALVGERALDGYILFPLLQNDLPARGQPGATEPNRLVLNEFRVRLEAGPGAPQDLADLFASPGLAPYLSYSVAWSGSVEPGGGNTSAGVTVVPAEVARQIAGSHILDQLLEIPLNARVTAVGTTLSDTIESKEFVYPIAACQYCLVAGVASCPAQPVNTGNPCNIAQDASVDCCDDGKSLVCPSRAPQS